MASRELRRFLCTLLIPEPGRDFGTSLMKGPVPITARSAKSAAEVFVLQHYPGAMRYKAGHVRIGVQENLDEPLQIFTLTITVTAKKWKPQ